MSKLNILFIVNGEGLGNIHRSLFVCEYLLQKNHKVTIATSGQAYEKIKSLSKYNAVKIESMPYAQSPNGRINFLKTFSRIFCWLRILIQNAMQLNALYKDAQFVFIDSEYSFVFLKFFTKSKARTISINNAAHILKMKSWNHIRIKLIPSIIIEICDLCFNFLFVDQILVPTLPGQTEFNSKLKSVPVFTRFTNINYQKKSSKIRKNIFIIPSSSRFQYGWEFLNYVHLQDEYQMFTIGFSVPDQAKFIELPKDFDLAQFPESIDLIISRGGLTAISEAVTLQAPILVLPFSNHFEQVINAHDTQNLGFGLILNPRQFSDDLARSFNLKINQVIDRQKINHIFDEILQMRR